MVYTFQLASAWLACLLDVLRFRNSFFGLGDQEFGLENRIFNISYLLLNIKFITGFYWSVLVLYRCPSDKTPHIIPLDVPKKLIFRVLSLVSIVVFRWGG